MGVLAVQGCVQKIVEPAGVPLNDGGAGSGDGEGDSDGLDAGAGFDSGTPSGGDDAGAKPDSGGGGGGDGSPCMSYCAQMNEACPNQFVRGIQQCLDFCEDMPAGSTSDRNEDSLGCRANYLERALDAQSAGDDEVLLTECNRAGPTGGNVCGERCDGFCDRVMDLCNDARAGIDAYASNRDCTDACDGYAVDVNNELPAVGDSLNCRIYHLTLAYANKDNPDQVLTHCGHTQPESSVCQGDLSPPP